MPRKQVGVPAASEAVPSFTEGVRTASVALSRAAGALVARAESALTKEEGQALSDDNGATAAQDEFLVPGSTLERLQVVKICVGGIEYHTLRTTLCAVPGSRLEIAFSGRHALRRLSLLGTAEEPVFFVDRDGERFASVIDVLRGVSGGEEADLPEDPAEIALLVAELEFFGLKGVVDVGKPGDTSSSGEQHWEAIKGRARLLRQDGVAPEWSFDDIDAARASFQTHATALSHALEDLDASVKRVQVTKEAEREVIGQLNAACAEALQLNVGGTRLMCARETICGTLPGSPLANSVSGQHTVAQTADGVFLDRNGSRFKTILNVLRCLQERHVLAVPLSSSAGAAKRYCRGVYPAPLEGAVARELGKLMENSDIEDPEKILSSLASGYAHAAPISDVAGENTGKISDRVQLDVEIGPAPAPGASIKAVEYQKLDETEANDMLSQLKQDQWVNSSLKPSDLAEDLQKYDKGCMVMCFRVSDDFEMPEKLPGVGSSARFSYDRAAGLVKWVLVDFVNETLAGLVSESLGYARLHLTGDDTLLSDEMSAKMRVKGVNLGGLWQLLTASLTGRELSEQEVLSSGVLESLMSGDSSLSLGSSAVFGAMWRQYISNAPDKDVAVRTPVWPLFFGMFFHFNDDVLLIPLRALRSVESVTFLPKDQARGGVHFQFTGFDVTPELVAKVEQLGRELKK